MGTDIRRKGRKYPWISKKSGNRRKGNTHRLPTASEMDARYKGSQWKAVREAVLFEYPTCVWCPYVGKTSASTQVDHIIKASEYDGSFYDKKNLVGCCSSCHSKKTSYETKGVRFIGYVEWGEYFQLKWRNKVKGY